MEPDSQLETAKAIANAVEATAEAAKDGIALVKSVGGYFGPMLKGPLTQASGILEDRLRYARQERLVRLQKRLAQELKGLGIETPIQQLPLDFGVRALEHAALEEEDELQDLWVRLLANTLNPFAGIVPRKSYVSILREFSPLDALIFDRVYALEPDATLHMAIVTSELPIRAYPAVEGQSEYQEPSDEVVLSLANLVRLGCLAFGSSWGGGEIYSQINVTRIGRDLHNALVPKNPSV